jgi:hypothetical protein
LCTTVEDIDEFDAFEEDRGRGWVDDRLVETA